VPHERADPVTAHQPSDPIREEAQRLIAAALTAAAAAASQTGGRFANGSAECCVCPICRVIAAMRDPDPDLAGRLAAGAGDLAVGVAGLLRSLATPAPRTYSDDEYGDPRAGSAHEPWHTATTAEPPVPPSASGAAVPPSAPNAAEPPTPPTAKAPMAKKAVKKAVKKAADKAENKADKTAAKAEGE
jgi:hypothetical protein